MKFSEFIRNLVVPTNLNIVSQPSRCAATLLVIFAPNLVFTVVDNMFGGDSRFHTRIEGRDFTPTEQRIIQRMLAVVLENYNKSWAPVHPINFEYQRSEMHTRSSRPSRRPPRSSSPPPSPSNSPRAVKSTS